MKQFLQWLAMGGYSIYVWPVYALFCFVLSMNFLSVQWQKKRTYQKLQEWFNDKK